MLQINPKKFRHIQNKAVPSPLRPKFRNKSDTNIYFLSKRKVQGEKSIVNQNIKYITSILIILIGGYFLTN